MSGTQDDNKNLDGKELENGAGDGETIDKKTYLTVSKDMHKYKDEAKALKQQLAKIQADQEAAKTIQMKNDEKWKDLHQASEAKLAQLTQQMQSERAKFSNFHKINAVVSEIGGFLKNDYNKFINVDAIEIDDEGNINQESVKAEGERLRKEYAELLKKTAVDIPTSQAPKRGTSVAKDVSQMNRQELEAEKQRVYEEMLKNNKPQ